MKVTYKYPARLVQREDTRIPSQATLEPALLGSLNLYTSI